MNYFVAYYKSLKSFQYNSKPKPNGSKLTEASGYKINYENESNKWFYLILM